MARDKQNRPDDQNDKVLESKIGHLLPPLKASCKDISECVMDIVSVIDTNEMLWRRNEEFTDQVAKLERIITEQEVELERLYREVLDSARMEDWCRRILLAVQNSQQDNEDTPRAYQRLPVPPPGTPTMKASLSGATLRSSSPQNLFNWSPSLE